MAFTANNISIKIKLTLAVFLTLAVITTAGFSFVMQRGIDRIQNELLNESRAYGLLLNQDFVELIVLGAVDMAADVTSRLRTQPKIQALTLYDKNRLAIYSYQQTGIENIIALPEGWQLQHKFNNGALTLLDTLRYKQQQYGYIFIQVSSEEINQSINSYFQQGSVVIIAMLLASLALALLIQRYFSQPVRLLASTLRQIAESHDFSIRLPVTRHDEIGDLFHGFNRMQGEIQRATKALRDRQFALDQHAIVAVTDVKGNIIYANDKFCQISGYSHAELIGKNHRIIKSAKHDNAFFKDMYHTIAKGKVWQGDICNRARDGYNYWVATTIVPFMGEDGKPRSYIAICTDVTARNQVKASLDRAQQMTHLGSWELDLVHNSLHWSAEVFRIFEIDPEKFAASYDLFAERVHPDDLDMANAAYTRSLESRENYEIEHRLLMPDGRIKIVRERCESYFDTAGKAIRSVGTVHDITESKHIEDALRRSQKMDAVGQLTGGIAHDFNNIIGIILGNVELLELQNITDEKIHKRIVPIKKSAQRAAKLTKQLLSFSRHKPYQQTLCNINQQITDMQSLIAHSVTPEVEVEYELAKDLWPVSIDPGDFQDAILNLVINARDAMNGRGHLTLESSNCTLDARYCAHNPGTIAGDYVQLIVSDTGQGIASEQQEHIFEPFFTTKPEGKGTGLGLAMVFGFVKRSSGFIKVYSEVGTGTTFRLYLPRKILATEEAAANRDKNQQIEANLPRNNLPGGNETVLVVDDEKGLRELAEDSLQDLGYKVLVACDGKQALDILAQEPDISLLFTDVVMPGDVNGFELAEQAAEKYPQLKILLTSGYTQKAVIKNGQAKFADNLLSKPYSREELAKRLRGMLD